jgi:hypothetical protein
MFIKLSIDFKQILQSSLVQCYTIRHPVPLPPKAKMYFLSEVESQGATNLLAQNCSPNKIA